MTTHDPLVKCENTLASADGSGPRKTYYKATLRWLGTNECIIAVVVRGYVAEGIDIASLIYLASKWDDIGKLSSRYALAPDESELDLLKEEMAWHTGGSPLCAGHHLQRVIELTEALLLAQFGERKEGADRVRGSLKIGRPPGATNDLHPKTGVVVVDDADDKDVEPLHGVKYS